MVWRHVLDSVEAAHQGDQPVRGSSADIVKAFNALRRPLVRDAMCHCGVDCNLVAAWLQGLDGIERHLLVAGNSYRAEPLYRTSSAGVRKVTRCRWLRCTVCAGFLLYGCKPRPMSCH